VKARAGVKESAFRYCLHPFNKEYSPPVPPLKLNAYYIAYPNLFERGRVLKGGCAPSSFKLPFPARNVPLRLKMHPAGNGIKGIGRKKTPNANGTNFHLNLYR
jgi:hypothetical protein